MTLGDLERWLKQDSTRTINVTLVKGGVRVIMGGVTLVSKTLDGAIENAMEELRRKDSGMDSVRNEKVGSTLSTTGPMPAYMMYPSSYVPNVTLPYPSSYNVTSPVTNGPNWQFSVPLAISADGRPTSTGGICRAIISGNSLSSYKTCDLLPDWGDGNYLNCAAGHGWSFVIGAVYQWSGVQGKFKYANGSWSMVAP